jgi:hypothetical protein
MLLGYYLNIELLDSWATLDLTGEFWLLLVHLKKFHLKCPGHLEFIIQFCLCSPLIFVIVLKLILNKIEIDIATSTLQSVISNCISVILTHVNVIMTFMRVILTRTSVLLTRCVWFYN